MFVYIKTPVKKLALAAALASLGPFAACGGDEGQPGVSGHQRVAVIEGWAGALAEGDVEAAAEFFALPSIAQNGPAPMRLRSRADALAFNRSLPCGAELIRARSAGRFIVAVFRLIDRPGGGCGGGSGRLARTAFAIQDGRITEWRRLADPGSGAGGPVV